MPRATHGGRRSTCHCRVPTETDLFCDLPSHQIIARQVLENGGFQCEGLAGEVPRCGVVFESTSAAHGFEGGEVLCGRCAHAIARMLTRLDFRSMTPLEAAAYAWYLTEDEMRQAGLRTYEIEAMQDGADAWPQTDATYYDRLMAAERKRAYRALNGVAAKADRVCPDCGPTESTSAWCKTHANTAAAAVAPPEPVREPPKTTTHSLRSHRALHEDGGDE